MTRRRRRASPLALLCLLPLTLLALALVWYGLMTVLLAAKVAPHTVDAISGYRIVYRFLATLPPARITPAVRLIAGLSGIATFLAGTILTGKALARPDPERSELTVAFDDLGYVVVRPRAIERAIEGAALRHPAVRGAAGRYAGDQMRLDVRLGVASDAAATLRDLRGRARAALARHDLPVLPVDVTLAGFEQHNRRELQ